MSNARELAELSGSYGTGGFVGMKNRIINGAMMIDQRNAGASVTPASTPAYITDRFAFVANTGSKFTLQQTPSATETGYATRVAAGFTNYLAATVATPLSIGASDYFWLAQAIEGLNVADLAWGTASAAPVTLSFWVRSSLTGTFGGSVGNASATRSYPFSYTISAANTWEQKTITIAGDTSGTWLTTNGIGIYLTFGLGVGSTYSGTAGSWSGSLYRSSTGATSVVGTSGATFYITGVQLEKGSTATSFDYRPYGTELALCQRYYYKLTEVSYAAVGMCSATTVARLNVPFPVSMRTSPTALEQNGTAADYNVNTGSSAVTCSSVPTFIQATTNNAATTFTVASGLTTGNGALGRGVGYLAWSAEL